MIEFEFPYLLISLLIIPIMLYWYFHNGQYQEGTMLYSDISLIPKDAFQRGQLKSRILLFLRLLIIFLILVALSRPRISNITKETTTDIIDIMLVIDQSSSMLAQDFKPNRLEAAKDVAKSFILDREGDRLGIIVFAGQSFIQCPLTTDIDVLSEFIEQINIVDKEYDGTAIGMAIANAINRLRFTESKSKLMILLSDGSNNRGELDPVTAAELASKFNIKIYTIGAGTMGRAPYPTKDIWGRDRVQMMDVEVDEETLKEIAKVTGGRFFRATDNSSLKDVYNEINSLERTKIEVTEFRNYKEMYSWLTIPAAFLAFGFIFLSQPLFRKKM